MTVRKPLRQKKGRAVDSLDPIGGSLKKCKRCDADLSALIIALTPACKTFQFCPCCGIELGYSVTVEEGKKQVVALKNGDQ